MQPLKFRNGYVISSHTLPSMWLLIHAGIKSEWGWNKVACITCLITPAHTEETGIIVLCIDRNLPQKTTEDDKRRNCKGILLNTGEKSVDRKQWKWVKWTPGYMCIGSHLNISTLKMNCDKVAICIEIFCQFETKTKHGFVFIFVTRERWLSWCSDGWFFNSTVS